MSERERISDVQVSPCAPVVSKRAPVEVGLDVDWEVPSPRSYPPPSPGARASPTRAGTLRWGDFARALTSPPPSVSPVRGGTLRWGELAQARAEAQRISRKSPVRTGTLQWGDMIAQLPAVLVPLPAAAAPPVVAAAPPAVTAARPTTIAVPPAFAAAQPATVAVPSPFAAAPPPFVPSVDRPPPRDLLDELPVDAILAPLLSARLVRRGGRDVARRRGVDDRRDPTEPPARPDRPGSSPDLASAIHEALDDKDGA